MDSLISIIVPVYNTENYLEKCLYSLVNQTYKNIRLIISAVIGSIYSILMYITKLTIYSSIISKSVYVFMILPVL